MGIPKRLTGLRHIFALLGRIGSRTLGPISRWQRTQLDVRGSANVPDDVIDRLVADGVEAWSLADVPGTKITVKVSALPLDDMQELVAGLLRSLGYKTRISEAGPDRVKDIVASRDGLGFESPRIVVEVKHRRMRWARRMWVVSWAEGTRRTRASMSAPAASAGKLATRPSGQTFLWR